MKLRNTFLAAAIVLGFATPSLANDYNAQEQLEQWYAPVEITDAEDFGDWSLTKTQILIDSGILVGYPDGSFRPNENLTREEFAVAIYNALIEIDMMISDLDDWTYEVDYYLYEEIINTQVALAALADRLGLVEETLGRKDNWVGISVQYIVDRDGDTSDTTIELNGKVQVVKISDTLALSIRPFVNTTTEVGASVSLDIDVSKAIELWTGFGAAYRLDQDVAGTITGYDDNVVPYAEVGVSLDLSDKTGVYLVTKTPLNEDFGKELTLGAGLKLNF